MALRANAWDKKHFFAITHGYVLNVPVKAAGWHRDVFNNETLCIMRCDAARHAKCLGSHGGAGGDQAIR